MSLCAYTHSVSGCSSGGLGAAVGAAVGGFIGGVLLTATIAVAVALAVLHRVKRELTAKTGGKCETFNVKSDIHSRKPRPTQIHMHTQREREGERGTHIRTD